MSQQAQTNHLKQPIYHLFTQFQVHLRDCACFHSHGTLCSREDAAHYWLHGRRLNISAGRCNIKPLLDHSCQTQDVPRVQDERSQRSSTTTSYLHLRACELFSIIQNLSGCTINLEANPLCYPTRCIHHHRAITLAKVLALHAALESTMWLKCHAMSAAE